MSEAFLALSADERREALAVAASASGRPAHLLEKDIWVVWALDALFSSPLGEHLVFKGGTSLSKAYGVIRRFSEDVDLTYDIRALAPDLVGETGDALPASRGEERRWTKAVGQRLPQWVQDHVLPTLQARFVVDGAPARLRLEGEKVFVEYEPLATGSGYVAPAVMLEFGARSTGEPSALHDVVCDAAGLVEGVVFPTASPMVMRAERTFWEKATAIHVFCAQGRLRGDRFARHWHDLARLDDAGLPKLPSPTRRWPRRSPITRPCSSSKRTRARWSSTIRRPCMARSIWRRTAKPAPSSGQTMRPWSLTACCSMTPNPSIS
ncbi:nucleotidyl transferase AbiEii/AbiGii toxin family protein [Phenylobacterium sp.]|uniref:nucleotidyl transferase AbiEii/AbiGii toxin family protein n=1 Tax=Phenylobacterium sp. TaxID=1871053 RepID=UPI0035615265